MGNSKASRLWDRPAWKWLFSLQAGLILLTLVAVASVIGTLITPLERAQDLIYYNWWYKTLLLLLALNISCATLRTIVDKILPLSRARIRRSPHTYLNVKPARSLDYAGDNAAVATALRRKGFRVAVEGDHGHAWRGRLGRWGAPIAHLGFIVVLLGGFASQWTSREGSITLLEGQQIDRYIPRENPNATESLGFTVRVEDFDTAYFPKTRIPSHFISTVTILEPGRALGDGQVSEKPLIKAEPVEVNRSPRVHGWKLHQTSYEESSKGTRYRLALAGPELPTTMTLEISPGQRRYVPGLPGAELALSQGTPLTWALAQPGRPLREGQLAGGGNGALSLVAERFEPDFVIGEGRQVTSRSRELKNPALKVRLLSGAQLLANPWLFGREDMKGMMHASQGDYDLELLKVTGSDPDWQFQVAVRNAKTGTPVGTAEMALGGKADLGATTPTATLAKPAPDGWRARILERVPIYRTTLTLTRNPAIPFIYLGCAIMMLGLLVTFFIRSRDLWFWNETARRRLHVIAPGSVAGSELDPAIVEVLDSLNQAPQKPARERIG